MKKPANQKAHELRAKLRDMAALGTEAGEREAAKHKLKRLEAAIDFNTAHTADLFKGVFLPASTASPVRDFSGGDWDIANAVKWALEEATKIPCIYRNGSLCALATPNTVQHLARIASTIVQGFDTLWTQYRKAGAPATDRTCFVRGLFDGMMNEPREPGQLLPARPVPKAKPVRAKKQDIARPAGLNVHPYTLALELGRQIRFSAPLADITAELERTIKGELKNEPVAPTQNPVEEQEATFGARKLPLGVTRAQWFDMAALSTKKQIEKYGTSRSQLIEKATMKYHAENIKISEDAGRKE